MWRHCKDCGVEYQYYQTDEDRKEEVCMRCGSTNTEEVKGDSAEGL